MELSSIVSRTNHRQWPRFCEIYEQLRFGRVYDPLKRKVMGDFKTSFFAIITQSDQNIGLLVCTSG